MFRGAVKVDAEQDERYDPNRLDRRLTAETTGLGSLPYLEWPLAGPRDKKQFGFCALHGDAFRVRSASYLSSRTKQPAGEALMQPLAMDWCGALPPPRSLV